MESDDRRSKMRGKAQLVLLDFAAAILLFLVGLSETRAAGDDIFFRSLDPLGVVLLAGVTLPTVVRRLAPIPVVVVSVVSLAVMLALGYPPTNAVLAIPFGLYSVACVEPRRRTVVLTVGSLLVFVPPAFDADTGSVQTLILSSVIFGAAALAGDGTKARRLYAEAVENRAARAEELRELAMREAVVAERTRLARELHDAVGHTVNVLVMHAGAGRLASARDPDRASEVLGEIEGIGRAALSDIDRLLGLLRDDGDGGATRQPAQGLNEIPALIDRLRATGLQVDFTRPGHTARVPLTVSTAAYRITQEALTNCVKHAGPAKVQVELVVSDEAVTVTVEDDGRGAGAVVVGDRVGRGLIGMRERVSLLGGTLTAAPRTGGGFRVRAVLPLAPKPGRSDIGEASIERSRR